MKSRKGLNLQEPGVTWLIWLGRLGLLGCCLALLACTKPDYRIKPAPAVSHHAAPSGDYYVVQRGDTLYSIAFRLDMNVKTLAQINDIAPPYRIFAGQRLATTVKIAPPRPNTNNNNNTGRNTPTAPTVAPPAAVVNEPIYENGPAIKWRWPLKGTLTRGFQDEGNKGIDITAQESESVTAAANGKVVYSGQGLLGYGNLIIVKHNDNYLSAYGNNSRLLVQEGDDLLAGQSIAEIAGRQPTLHFEIRRAGKPVNPLDYLPKR